MDIDVKSIIIRALQSVLAGLVIGNFILPYVSVVFVPVLLIFVYYLIKYQIEKVFNR